MKLPHKQKQRRLQPHELCAVLLPPLLTNKRRQDVSTLPYWDETEKHYSIGCWDLNDSTLHVVPFLLEVCDCTDLRRPASCLLHLTKTRCRVTKNALAHTRCLPLPLGLVQLFWKEHHACGFGSQHPAGSRTILSPLGRILHHLRRLLPHQQWTGHDITL